MRNNEAILCTDGNTLLIERSLYVDYFSLSTLNQLQMCKAGE